MKTATRIQLINWHYFTNEIIPLGEINFLTGANSAGKSTIIDALQVAIMGETKSSFFNRAAGKKSERTLRSYLVGTLGDDISSGVKALRDGKDFSSYIVVEFYDDVKNEYFCIGFIADVFSDGGDEKKRFFILNDLLPSEQFIKGGKTVDCSSFIKWCRQNYPASKFQSFDTVKDYNSGVLRRTNVHEAKLFSMLRKAIAFEPINNIEEFITTNICDVEKNIDTYGMQEDIRSYQETEQQAKRMEKRLESLTKICGEYSEVQKLRARKKLQQFFIDYGNFKYTEEKLSNAEKHAEKLSQSINGYKQQEEQLTASAVSLGAENDRLENERNQFLNESQKELLEERKRSKIREMGNEQEKEQKFISSVNRNSGKWVGRCDVILEEISEQETSAEIESLRKMLKRISVFSEKSIGDTSSKHFSDIKELYSSASQKVRPSLDDLSVKKSVKLKEKSQLEETISKLHNKQKDYPSNARSLKNAIQRGLSEKYGKDIKVDFLADLIEVTDEEWKNAAEGILANDRMNIIVSPEYFMDAYYIYKRICKQIDVYEYSVVDLERVFSDQQTVMIGSMAQVVSCDDKYIRAYLDFLLGRVMRCYDDKDIRKYRTSVTRDCMVYRRYSVKPINPYHYAKPFIGSKSVEIQLKQAEDNLLLCNAEIQEICSHIRNMKPFFDDWFITQEFIENTAMPAYEAYSKLPEIRNEIAEIDDQLSRIDNAKLAEIESAIRKVTAELSQNTREHNQMSINRGVAEHEYQDYVDQTIPALSENAKSLEAKLHEDFSDEFIEQTGQPAYFEKLGQYGAPDKVSGAFLQPIKSTGSLLTNAESELRKQRGEYNQEFHFSLNISNVETNDEYDKDYQNVKDIQLPDYIERIAKAKETAMISFKNDFLNKLKANIKTVIDQISDLNRALRKAKFGNNTYSFECKPDPDYIEYYSMIMAAEEGETLFSYEFMNKYKDTIDNLFAQLESFDRSDAAAAEAVDRLSRYSTYLTFDILQKDSNGITEPLSKTIFSKSGGEIQTPFYVAMLASFVQLYKVNDTRNQMDNTMRLVIFDEAFNKMDPERITECISMLRHFGLQAIICSPTDKAGDIVPLCDRTLLVDKQPDGNAYRSVVIEWKKEMGVLQ